MPLLLLRLPPAECNGTGPGRAQLGSLAGSPSPSPAGKSEEVGRPPAAPDSPSGALQKPAWESPSLSGRGGVWFSISPPSCLHSENYAPQSARGSCASCGASEAGEASHWLGAGGFPRLGRPREFQPPGAGPGGSRRELRASRGNCSRLTFPQ